MGLLDALFSAATYGGQGGGLLDLIRQSQAQNSQYQPSVGFGDNQPSPLDNAQWPAGPTGAPSSATFSDRFNAMPGAPAAFNPAPRQMDASNFDPATFAPNQAQPISIAQGDGSGTYQLPRLGSADQYSPQQAALPPNSQPTQGQLPPQAAQDQGPGFGSRLNAGFQNFANAGGPLQAIAGAVSGLASGARTDPLGMQQQSQAQTYNALLEAGMPKNVAMAAALNPKILEQVGPGYFAKNEIVDGGTDPLTGKKTFVLKNTVDGTVKELNGGAASGDAGTSQGVADTIAQAKAKGATREQLLQLVPASYRPYVDAVLQDKALPTNMGRGAARMQIMGLAHAVDGNFNEENIPFRLDTRRDYSPKGKSGQSIVALNTVQHHIGQLSDALESKDLGDTGWTYLNKIRNGLAQNTPLDPKQGSAIKQVEDAMTAVEDEMANAYKAGKVSDKEIQRWHELTDPNKPLWQQKQGIKDFVGLLNGKRDQLNETHQSILGEDAPGINKELNQAITKTVNSRSDALNAKNNSGPKVGEVQQGFRFKGGNPGDRNSWERAN